MAQIPVYVFTGFLDAGKTKFIQETLEDERFNAGERTLLLVFEEGEEEYDFSTYPHQNVYLEVLDQQTVTTKQLQALQKKYKAQRIVAELNGMQLVGDLYSRFPEDWVVAQGLTITPSGEVAQMLTSTSSKQGLNRETWAALLKVGTRRECPEGNPREPT